MDDVIVWTIIIAFYAPLHYLLPILVLFISGNESEPVRRRLIRGAVLDATLSMVAAFALVIYLAQQQHLSAAMLTLLLSMLVPFLRIWRHRSETSPP